MTFQPNPEPLRWITPDWPVPTTIHAATTLRHGGASQDKYASLNLGDHVGDDATAVAMNRQYLQQALALPSPPLWLKQVHGVDCVDAAESVTGCEADASFTTQAEVVCAVLTADCLPLLLCDKNGTAVAAVHAGWRGLAAGVVESAIAAMRGGVGGGGQLLAWLGPAIGAQRFAVGAEVRASFVARDNGAAAAFVAVERDANGEERWLANLCLLATLILKRAGVDEIYGGQWCSVSEHEAFYSYRRDGVTGRMATLIWMSP